MLAFRTVGAGRPLIIVHGLFGSGDNWATLAGKFPGRQVFLPDLRNHGNSPWFDEFTLADLAADLAGFHQQVGLPPCPWVGHSLGGKAVMELSLTHPESVTGVGVVDMAPREYQPQYTGFVAALRSLDLAGISGRSDAQRALSPKIPDVGTLQFLLKSLVPQEGTPGWRWKLNLASLEANYPEIWRAVAPGRSWDGPVLFLYGTASNYVLPGDEVLAGRLFPRAAFRPVAGGGHWLHAEKPAEVVGALQHWLEGNDL